MQLKRLSPADDFTALHALLTQAFAYMENRIDPPSSLHAMTPESLARDALTRETWVLTDGTSPLACMILTARPDTLYLGKLATAPSHRGTGLARHMIAHAETCARTLGLPSITLQTRVELVENHAAFTRLGFARSGETAHPGYDRPTSFTFVKSL
jgi:GNAT superfamily N-acetyltransferase